MTGTLHSTAGTAHWREVLRDVWLFRDSCNVYAVRGPRGLLIIDGGSGAWLEHLDELPAPPVALACTHYLRDHSAGAVAAARRGIAVYVPEGEQAIFTEPAEHFRCRETYIIYDNLWNLFAPIEGVTVAGVLRDYDRIELAGLKVEVIPQPGATLHQVGLGVRLPGQDGSALAVFCGETIHSPGRVARLAPLQYNYNDLGGAVQCFYSAELLRRRSIAALLPSLGEPMLTDADGALKQLQDNLRAIHDGRKAAAIRMDQVLESDDILQVTENVWRSGDNNAMSWFLRSRSGKVLAIDYGYPRWALANMPARPSPANRRAILHSLPGIKKHLGADRIDVMLISHFHDDHVTGVPLLQRLFGVQCWAAENFADLLAHPEAHCFPCNWSQPIQIHRRLALDRPFTWEEYTFHLHPMSGHTRFASLIGFEADGKRFAHTGDQYFFQRFTPGAAMDDFADNPIDQNHVYRNGALLDGYQESGDWLLKWCPEIVLQGHLPPWFSSTDFFDAVARWSGDYRRLHERIMPLGPEDAHFNADSWGGWIWPYRTHLEQAGPATMSVTVRNPLPEPATLDVRLVGPTGWTESQTRLSAAARAEARCELTITPSGPCRRQPFAAELTVNGRPFGQVAEALMTVGGRAF